MSKELLLICALGWAGIATTEVRAEEKATETKATAQAEENTNPVVELELTPTEQTVLEMTNQERVQRGLKPFVIDPSLVESARQHADWMASTRTMRHTSKPVGENIAQGQATCTQVMRTWMNSSGHRANILGGWNRVGAAAYTTPEGRIYWCLQFLK